MREADKADGQILDGGKTPHDEHNLQYAKEKAWPIAKTWRTHKREYYLKYIPFTEEQVEASNLIIMDGLHHSGVIFKDKLNNLRLGERQLRRLTDQYPSYEKMDDVYYHLYLLYMRKGEPQMADVWLSKLKADYPESQWTTLLTDPYFEENARFGTHM